MHQKDPKATKLSVACIIESPAILKGERKEGKVRDSFVPSCYNGKATVKEKESERKKRKEKESERKKVREKSNRKSERKPQLRRIKKKFP